MRKILVVASAFVLAVALVATIARASDPQGNPASKVTIPVDLAGVTCPAQNINGQQVVLACSGPNYKAERGVNDSETTIAVALPVDVPQGFPGEGWVVSMFHPAWAGGPLMRLRESEAPFVAGVGPTGMLGGRQSLMLFSTLSPEDATAQLADVSIYVLY